MEEIFRLCSFQRLKFRCTQDTQEKRKERLVREQHKYMHIYLL